MPESQGLQRYPGPARHLAKRKPTRSLLNRLHTQAKKKVRTAAEIQALCSKREEEKKYTSAFNDAMGEVLEIVYEPTSTAK